MLYNAMTSYERLFADDRAVEVLKRYVPEVYYGTNREDAEAMSKCLNDSKIRVMLFRRPTDRYDAAITAISTIRSEL